MIVQEIFKDAVTTKVSFWYKGQGVEVTPQLIKITVDQFIQQIHDGVDGIKEDIDNHEDGPTVLYGELMKIKEKMEAQGQLNVEEVTTWAINIYALTTLGYLKNDDNNGLMIYRKNEKGDIWIDK